jgi:hypothetical protein
MMAFGLVGSAGCNRDVPDKKTQDEKKPASSRYDSIAVLPCTGDILTEQQRFEVHLPEAIARVEKKGSG